MPANAAMVFGQLTKIAAFDIIEIGDYVDEYFKLEATDPVNEKFEAVGLETLYLFHNIGSFIFVIILYAFAILIFLILTIFGSWSQRIKRWSVKLGQKLFWNSIIVAVLESFLFMSFCCLILWKYSFEFSPWGVAVQSVIGIAIFVGYVYIPLKTLFNLAKNFD